MPSTDTAPAYVEHASSPELAAELARRGVQLDQAERLLCVAALRREGGIIAAARSLGISRHALKRRMIKHEIHYRPTLSVGETPEVA